MFRLGHNRRHWKSNDSLEIYFQGRVKSLNLVRAILAAVVCVSHVGWIYGEDMLQIRSLGVYSVCIFFGLSGFLICQSAYQSSGIRDFSIKRIRRIYPAFLLVLFTTSWFYYPIYIYISTSSFQAVQVREQILYITNNIGLHVSKPKIEGSLQDSGTLVWNPSLWTLKYEFILYFLCFLLSRLCIRYSQRLVYLITISCFTTAEISPHGSLIQELTYLGQFFFIGMIIWHLRKNVNIGNGIIAITSLAIFLSYSILEVFALTSSLLILLTLVLSTRLKCQTYINSDYSYGIYLHAGPITHLVALATKDFKASVLFAYLLSLFLSIFLGALSWHAIESRFSNRKSQRNTN